jgi:hypothetical protein
LAARQHRSNVPGSGGKAMAKRPTKMTEPAHSLMYTPGA